MIRVLLLAAVAPLLAGCLVGKAATGAVKMTGKAVGTVVETGWDAVTTTPQEAEEDRAKEADRARRRQEGEARPD
ncbi:hypothetical protein [Thermaurantiacus sp.]